MRVLLTGICALLLAAVPISSNAEQSRVVMVPAASAKASVIMPPQGGNQTLPGLFNVTWPKGSFPQNTKVTLSAVADASNADDFDQTVGPDVGATRLYELCINTGDAIPAKSIPVTVILPDAFLKSVPPGASIKAFVETYQETPHEFLNSFDMIDPKINLKARTVAFNVAVEAFTAYKADDKSHEAVLTIGWVN